jgi:murein DD-endopeptidase MepM/ murein hydrolase activator NlpD
MKTLNTILTGVCLMLIACTPSAARQSAPTVSGVNESTPPAMTTSSLERLEDQPDVSSCPQGNCSTPDPTSLPGIATQPAPLQLVLPTLNGEPASGWRPPLYPVPWAVSPNDHFYFQRPIAANYINFILPDYRYGGLFTGTDIVHTGIDIPADPGTPVLAAAPGTVTWAGYGLYSQKKSNKDDPYGKAVVIRHDFGHQGRSLFTVYAHLSQIDVAEGQWVDAGQQIGLVGSTGFTTGPHLHFEVRIDAGDYISSRNPELWLVPPQGWGVLVGSVQTTYGALFAGRKVYVQGLDNDINTSVFTYGLESVNPDEYYNENLVLSDLPAGRYRILVPFLGALLDHVVEIRPGQITYFKFKGFRGYFDDPPPIPGLESLTPAP